MGDLGLKQKVNDIIPQWAGRVFGTNTGNLYLEFESTTPDQLTGTLRFMDNAYGLVVYEINGTFSDTLKLQGTAVQSPEGIATGDLEVEARLTSEGHLQGSWKTALGTAGAFVAFPHNAVPQQPKAGEDPMVPEQLYTKNINIGAVRLFRRDVQTLINSVKQDFVTGKVVVTFSSNGSEATKYENAFFRDAEKIESLTYLKISIQEHEAYGINKVVIIELRAYGENEIRVQGMQESWVVGKAETLAATIKHYQSSLITTYKKFGLNLNQIIFLGMLIVMPSIETWENRAIFTGVVIVILNILLLMHARFVPNATIKLIDTTPTIFDRLWPAALSWFGAVLSAFVAGYVLYLLTQSQ